MSEVTRETDLEVLMNRVWDQSEINGWHSRWKTIQSLGSSDDETDHIMAKLALITSEVAEAIEEVRKPHKYYPCDTYYSVQTDGSKKPEGFPSEMADAVIRIMDLCRMLDVDLVDAINEKLDYNDTRGYRHGGKKV